MDKESKIALLNLLMRIKAERKALRGLFGIMSEKKNFDRDEMNKLLDMELRLRVLQEEIEKKLNY